MSKAPIVLAVDTPDLHTAISWVKATQDHISVFKLGLEFFLTFGAEGVKAIQAETDSDISVFSFEVLSLLHVLKMVENHKIISNMKVIMSTILKTLCIIDNLFNIQYYKYI